MIKENGCYICMKTYYISESNKNVINQEKKVASEHGLLGFAYSTRKGYEKFAWQRAKNDRS